MTHRAQGILLHSTLSILLVIGCGIPVAAQSGPMRSWDTVRAVKPGEQIQIRDAEGNRHHGTLTSVSADAITLQTRRGPLSIDASRVRTVQTPSSSRRLRNLVIGAAIGVGVGVAIDQSVGTYLRNESGFGPGARAVTYVAPIAVGGGLGALPAYRTIYRAP